MFLHLQLFVLLRESSYDKWIQLIHHLVVIFCDVILLTFPQWSVSPMFLTLSSSRIDYGYVAIRNIRTCMNLSLFAFITEVSFQIFISWAVVILSIMSLRRISRSHPSLFVINEPKSVKLLATWFPAISLIFGGYFGLSLLLVSFLFTVSPYYSLHVLNHKNFHFLDFCSNSEGVVSTPEFANLLPNEWNASLPLI